MGNSKAVETAEGAEDTRALRSPRMLTIQIRGERFGATKAVVRNISDEGLGGMTQQWLSTGELVQVELPNIGWTVSRVAWRDGTRFGLAFVSAVDAQRVTRNVAPGMDMSFRVHDRYRPETSVKRPGLGLLKPQRAPGESRR